MEKGPLSCGPLLKEIRTRTEEYKCAMCGGIFEKTTSEEDALIELHEQFGEGIAVEDCDIVCNDCWEKVRPDNPHNKEIFKSWQNKG